MFTVASLENLGSNSTYLLNLLTLSLQLLVNVFSGLAPCGVLFKFMCPYCLGGTLRGDLEWTYWIGAAASAILICLYCCLPVSERARVYWGMGGLKLT